MVASGGVRQVDADEWFMSGHGGWQGQLRAAIADPEVFSRALRNALTGETLVVWGVSPGGVCWLIASKLALPHGRTIHRLWRKELALLTARYTVLKAWCYHRNKLHHRWLKAIGFERLGEGRMEPFMTRFSLFTLTHRKDTR